MSSPRSEQLTRFFLQVYRASKLGTLEWEETAKTDVFVAGLGNDLTVQVERADEFDSFGGEPTVTVSLARGGRPAATLTPTDVDIRLINEEFGVPRGRTLLATSLFKEVWERAQLRATQLEQALGEASSLLGERIAGKAPAPPPQTSAEDDDDVPF